MAHFSNLIKNKPKKSSAGLKKSLKKSRREKMAKEKKEEIKETKKEEPKKNPNVILDPIIIKENK